MARSEREEKGSRGACGPKRRKRKIQVKEKQPGVLSANGLMHKYAVHNMAEVGMHVFLPLLCVLCLCACVDLCVFSVCCCSGQAVMAEHAAVCVCRLWCTFKHEAHMHTHVHTQCSRADTHSAIAGM